jgi:hypothetical protein
VIYTPNIFYASPNGNDSTAEMSNPAKPFTAQGAFYAIHESVSSQYLIFLFPGNHAITSKTRNNTPVGWDSDIQICGSGAGLSKLTITMPNGSNGDNGSDTVYDGSTIVTPRSGGFAGTDSPSAYIVDAGYKSFTLTFVAGNGGNGGAPGADPQGQDMGASGGNGGNAGSVTLVNCVCAAGLTLYSGNGGSGSDASLGFEVDSHYGGTGGINGTISLINSEVFNVQSGTVGLSGYGLYYSREIGTYPANIYVRNCRVNNIYACPGPSDVTTGPDIRIVNSVVYGDVAGIDNSLIGPRIHGLQSSIYSLGMNAAAQEITLDGCMYAICSASIQGSGTFQVQDMFNLNV